MDIQLEGRSESGQYHIYYQRGDNSWFKWSKVRRTVNDAVTQVLWLATRHYDRPTRFKLIPYEHKNDRQV